MTASHRHGDLVPFRGVLACLGQRELEVVCCLACGDEAVDIARYLNLPSASVRAAMRRATRRLGLADEASLRKAAEVLLPPGRQRRPELRLVKA